MQLVSIVQIFYICFANLKEAHDQYGPFEARNIYNLDKTVLMTVQLSQKDIAPRDEKQISSVTSAKRGTRLTCIAATNAIGIHIPPFLVFPRVHFKEHMITNCRLTVEVLIHLGGRMKKFSWNMYLIHFTHYTKISKENLIVLCPP